MLGAVCFRMLRCTHTIYFHERESFVCNSHCKTFCRRFASVGFHCTSPTFHPMGMLARDEDLEQGPVVMWHHRGTCCNASCKWHFGRAPLCNAQGWRRRKAVWRKHSALKAVTAGNALGSAAFALSKLFPTRDEGLQALSHLGNNFTSTPREIFSADHRR